MFVSLSFLPFFLLFTLSLSLPHCLSFLSLSISTSLSLALSFPLSHYPSLSLFVSLSIPSSPPLLLLTPTLPLSPFPSSLPTSSSLSSSFFPNSPCPIPLLHHLLLSPFSLALPASPLTLTLPPPHFTSNCLFSHPPFQKSRHSRRIFRVYSNIRQSSGEIKYTLRHSDRDSRFLLSVFYSPILYLFFSFVF